MDTVEKAVNWWVEQLQGEPKHDAGDAGLNLSLRMFALRSTPPTTEQVEQFRDALTRKVTKALETGDVLLCTDYEPEELLKSVIDETRINYQRFPIKTIMWVNKDNVTVASGYRAPRQEL